MTSDEYIKAIQEINVAALQMIDTSLFKIPQYIYDVGPCPVCGGTPTGLNAQSEMTYAPISTLQPCGHHVSCQMVLSPEEGGVVHVVITFTPQAQAYQYFYSTSAPLQPLTGIAGDASIITQLLAVCPALRTVQRQCPVQCGTPITCLGDLIPHINDYHKWTREKIADWLDVIALDPDVDLTIKPLKKKEEANAQPSIGTGEVKDEEYAW